MIFCRWFLDENEDVLRNIPWMNESLDVGLFSQKNMYGHMRSEHETFNMNSVITFGSVYAISF